MIFFIFKQNLKKEFTNPNLNSNISCLIKKCTNKNNERKIAIRNLSLAVNSGEVLGLLGHNGAGKTTTMRIITMEEKETTGKVRTFFKTCSIFNLLSHKYTSLLFIYIFTIYFVFFIQGFY